MSESTVELVFAGLEHGRPPMKTLRFDAVLRNVASERRWFLLPSALWRDPPPDTGVDAMQAWTLAGAGRVVIGRFQGTLSFQAVLVPGGAEVRIDGLKIAFWEEIAGGPAGADAVVARSVSVGGDPIESWFDADPASDPGAHVVDDATAERAGSQRSVENGPRPVIVDAEVRTRIELDPARVSP